MFFNFLALFVNMCFFEVALFFLNLYLLSQLNFINAGSHVKDSWFWWSILSTFQSVFVFYPLFPIYVAITVTDTNSFNPYIQLINPNFLKKGSQTDKD